MTAVLYITTYNTGGAGIGPILTASGFRYTERLSRMGDWAFNVPIADPRVATQIIPFQTYVEISAYIHGEIVPLVAGKVEKINRSAPDQITVEGFDLLRLLTYRRLIDYSLFVDTQYNANAFVYHLGVYTPVTAATSIAFNDTDSFLFVGYTEPFDFIDIALDAGNTDPGEANWGFSGSDPARWREPGVTDGTIFDPGSGDAYLGQSGNVKFVKSGDWQLRTVNGLSRFWMRLDPQVVSSLIKFDDVIKVRVRRPVLNDVETILAAFVPTWSSTCEENTPTGTIMDFAGETVLEALIKIADRHGNYFTLGGNPFDTEICWLWGFTLESPVVLVQTTNPQAGKVYEEVGPFQAYFESIGETIEADNLITRLYVFGNGNADARLTLQYATGAHVPVGWTYNTGASYIQNDAAVLLYGVIEGIFEVSDLGATDGGSSTSPQLADQLMLAGVTYLQNHSAIYQALNLKILSSSEPIRPGSKVNCMFNFQDNEGNIVWSYNTLTGSDPTLIVLEATYELTDAGYHTTALTVAKVPRWPRNDADIIVAEVRRNRDYRWHPQSILQRQVRPEDYTNL